MIILLLVLILLTLMFPALMRLMGTLLFFAFMYMLASMADGAHAQPIDLKFPEYDSAYCHQSEMCYPSIEKFAHDSMAIMWDNCSTDTIIAAKTKMNQYLIAETYGNLLQTITAMGDNCTPPQYRRH